MTDNIQIVLFIKSATLYNPKRIVAEIGRSLPSLGSAMMFPLNKEEYSAPLFVYNQNSINVHLSASLNTVAILYEANNEKKHKEILFEVMRIFENEDIQFDRIGYVVTKGLDWKDVKKLKAKLFKDEDIIEAPDFQIGWYNPISLNGTKANCWQRYFPDLEVKKLISVFDINTPQERPYSITEEFVDTFTIEARKYVDNKIKI